MQKIIKNGNDDDFRSSQNLLIYFHLDQFTGLNLTL